jgi:EAL domain-containing protein (putative c-di-GMP-specific phosphodiesterase class I)
MRTSFTLVGTPYLEYHPVVDLSSGRLLGMEALVRWLHPTEGRISPDQLIPRAEASGDIGPLTRWIVMEACEQANRWSPSIQLGVNCTVHQLRRGDVSQAVAEALERTGFHGGQLNLEVTEEAIVDAEASAQLRILSQMGVQLSVDDVGTNWSSFELLKRNSISTLKIDGSFIAGLEHSEGINRLVVETVIHMAHSLGMSAIVERVETASQVQIVRSFRADAAQGFFFATPMSSEDAEAFASGPGIPQFSLTSAKTLVKPHAAPIDLALIDVDSPSGVVVDPSPCPTDDRVVGVDADTDTDTEVAVATDTETEDAVDTDTENAADTEDAVDTDTDTDTEDAGGVDAGGVDADAVDATEAPTRDARDRPEDVEDPEHQDSSHDSLSQAVEIAWAEGAAWAHDVDSPPGLAPDVDDEFPDDQG